MGRVIRLRTVYGVIAASVSALVIACGARNQTAPSPPAASSQPQIGSVEGIVKHESYFSGRYAFPIGPQTGAQVIVTDGPATATTFTTGADGAYHFDLPVGPFRLQWSAQFYEAQASAIGMVQAGATTKMSDVVLRVLGNLPVPPWTISGVVSDRSGNPVADALVSASDSPISSTTTYAKTMTDSAGQFRMISTIAHVDFPYIVVNKAGYVQQATRFACCDSAAQAMVNVQLVRIVSVTLTMSVTQLGSNILRVGETAQLSGRVVLDDGTNRAEPPGNAVSGDSRVVVIRPRAGVPPTPSVPIEGINAGSATITWTPYGSVRATLQVQVIKD